jgi:hypothetical protein
LVFLARNTPVDLEWKKADLSKHHADSYLFGGE